VSERTETAAIWWRQYMIESPLMRVGAAICSVAGSNAEVERRFAARQRMMKDSSRSTLEESKWHKMLQLKCNLRIFDERLNMNNAQKQYVYVGGSAHIHANESASGVQGLADMFDHAFIAENLTDDDELNDDEQTVSFSDEDVAERAISPVPRSKRARQQEWGERTSNL